MDTTSGPKRHESPLNKFIATNDLYDVWRCCHADELDYTYLSLRHNTYSWIYLFVTDKWLLQKISASTIHTVTWSDPVSITLLRKPSHHNTYLWRTNNFLLQDPTYAPTLSKHVEDYFSLNSNSVEDPATVWNAHKAVIRGIFIQ